MSQKSLDESFTRSCFNGDLEHIKVLIKQGANIHAHEDYGLRYAGHLGHADVVAYLFSLEPNSLRWNDDTLDSIERSKHFENFKIKKFITKAKRLKELAKV